MELPRRRTSLEASTVSWNTKAKIANQSQKTRTASRSFRKALKMRKTQTTSLVKLSSRRSSPHPTCLWCWAVKDVSAVVKCCVLLMDLDVYRLHLQCVCVVSLLGLCYLTAPLYSFWTICWINVCTSLPKTSTCITFSFAQIGALQHYCKIA